MSRNRNFSQTIQYTGKLDVSNIIAALQKIRGELANSPTLKNKEGVFVNVDREIKNLENLSTRMKEAIQKGFSNPKDIRDFEKITESLDTALNRVAVDLKNIHADKLTQELRAAREELEKQKQNLSSVIAEEKNRINFQLQGIKNGKKYTDYLIQEVKSGRDLLQVQEAITKEIDNQIQKQRDSQKEAQARVNATQANLANARSTDAIRPGIQARSFKKITTEKLQTDLNAKEYKKVEEAFNQIIPKAKSADEAVKKFTQELQKMNIIASKDSLKKVKQSFDDYQKSVSKLKQTEKDLKSTETAINNINNQIKYQEKLKETASEKDKARIGAALTRLNAELTVRKALKTEQEALIKSLNASRNNLPINQSDFKKTTINTQQAAIEKEEFQKIQQIFKETIANATSADNAVKRFKEELTKMNITSSQAAIDRVSTSFKIFQTNVKNAENELKIAERELNKITTALTESQARQINIKNILSEGEIKASVERIKAALNSLTQALTNANNAGANIGNSLLGLTAVQSGIKDYSAAAKDATQNVNELAQKQQKLDGTFDHFLRYIQYTFSLVNGIRVLRRVIQSTFNDVKSLDKAFASIAMVTNYSVQDMWKSYDDYAEMARKLGQSTEDVIKSSALFYQQNDAFYI